MFGSGGFKGKFREKTTILLSKWLFPVAGQSWLLVSALILGMRMMSQEAGKLVVVWLCGCLVTERFSQTKVERWVTRL